MIHARRRFRAVKFAVAAALAALVAPGLPVWAAATLPPASQQSDVSDAAASPPGSKKSNSADQIQEVVVTAQFRRQLAQKTPLALTAVDADMLRQRGQTSVVQLENEVPNLTLKPQGASFGPSIVASIRGIGQDDFNPELEPGVGMYIDDVYYGTMTAVDFDLLDLDRVEVLRGPQGILAGMNSIGGAIKLYSQQPTGSNQGFAQVSYGNYDHVGARGDFDIALVPARLFMRVSAATEHQRGYVTRVDYGCSHPDSGFANMAGAGSCTLGYEGGTDFTGGRVMLRWIASDNLEVHLEADGSNSDTENPATTLLYAHNTNPNVEVNGTPYDSRFIPSDPYVNYASFYMPGGTVGGVQTQPLIGQDQQILHDGGVAATVDWSLGNGLSLKSISAYRRYTADWAEDPSLSPENIYVGLEHLEHRQLSQEVRLNGGFFGNAVEYTLGGFYFDQDTDYDSHEDLRYVSPLYDFLGSNEDNARSQAGFAHAVWHLTRKLSLAGGVRYSSFENDSHFGRLNPDGTPSTVLGSLNGVTGSYSGTHWDYRANVSFNWTQNVMTYAQVSTGFRGGGVNPRPFIASQVQPFGPETLTAYEVGLKSTLFDHHMLLNGALFYSVYNDIQLTLLSCPQYSPSAGFPCALPENAGDADIKGAELETQIYPVYGLQLDSSISYLKFSYTSINPQAGGPTEPAGVQMYMTSPYTPTWKWSAGVQYAINIGAAGTLIPRLDAAYQSSLYTAAVNASLNEIHPYTLLNARLAWDPLQGNWEVALEAKNVTNRLYYLTVFQGAAAGGFVYGQPGPPREWTITVSKQF